MVVLNTERKTKKIKLETLQGGEVDMTETIFASDMDKIMKATDSGKKDNLLGVLEILIADWNLTDENEKKLPINQENIGKLDFRDFQLLAESINEIYKDFLGEGVKTDGNTQK